MKNVADNVKSQTSRCCLQRDVNDESSEVSPRAAVVKGDVCHEHCRKTLLYGYIRYYIFLLVNGIHLGFKQHYRCGWYLLVSINKFFIQRHFKYFLITGHTIFLYHRELIKCLTTNIPTWLIYCSAVAHKEASNQFLICTKTAKVSVVEAWN